MNKIKTKVLMSKSSNTTISKDNKKQDTKSWSNAEIQPFSLKKRGVYVEKKSTKTSMTEDIDNSPKKSKVIRRPGKKRFLDSILTILSKSTTGTQFPDLSNKANKMKPKRKKLYEQNFIGDLNTVKKQPKYRSRVLNEYKDLDLDKVVVLQSRKEIIQTPSSNSQKSKDRDSIKWSDIVPPLVPKTDSTITVINTNAKAQQLSLIDHIEYGKEDNERNATPICNTDEPITLVANEKQNENNKLYNFFVDLLESTFNVYNAKTELAPSTKTELATSTKTELAPSNKSSKLVLETNHSEVNKLNKENTLDYNFVEDTQNEIKTKHEYYISDDWDDTLLDGVKSMSLRDLGPELPLTKPKERPKLKSESFSYKKKKLIPVTRSFIYQNIATPPKKLWKKDRKKNLLNLLKEQLRIEDDRYEPPKNFFESLQKMAKYKSRCQKSIHFEESTKKASVGSVYDCMYKRRRLLSSTSKNSYKSITNTSRSFRSFSYKSTVCSRSKSGMDYRLDNDTGSRLSLAVYTYDVNQPTMNTDKRQKKIIYEPTVSTASSNSSVFDSVIQHESFSQW